MPDRSRRRASLAALPTLIAVASCHTAPMRGSLALRAPAIVSRTVSAGTDAGLAALTLTTDSGTVFVDAKNDDETVNAIRSVVTSRVRELKVDRDGRTTYVRLRPASAVGDYGRLFIINGIPLSDGFGLSIRAATLRAIDVVDDSASKAPYGPRGAKGVVVLTVAMPN